ncbi:MAG: purine-nucleoside phosphorylase [Acidobacteria bacterium]|nr:purine-nucleoside phosphorylase [Acidobacteriota bacterium]
MSDLIDALDAAVDVLRGHAGDPPDVAVVLGSGLGDYASTLAAATSLPYTEIPGWPASNVVGHAGRLVVGTHASGASVAALAGRVHLYEGHPVSRVVFGVRVLARWGVPRLLLTNAAGGINTAFTEGALMLIDDHINLLGANPLVGPNESSLGARFPDMTHVYDPRLRRLAMAASGACGVPLQHGVYLATLGPSYETPAEIRAFRTLGADAVGMSTVPEAIAARHMGMAVAGISCITNPAAGVLPGPLDHEDVMKTAARVRGQFTVLLDAFIARLPRAGHADATDAGA